MFDHSDLCLFACVIYPQLDTSGLMMHHDKVFCKINELIFLYLNQDRKIKLTMECQWEIHVVVISRLLWRSLRCTLGLPYTNTVHIRKPPAAHINLAKIL